MNRLRITALAAVAGLMPCVVWALGLGELQVNSKLNQPLDAEIELLYDDESEPQSTQVSLAAPEDFDRVGLDPTALSVRLAFEVQRNAAGRYVIAVTSRELVTDPFLDFLIDVNWPNGRLLREYVVLLDPPVTPPSGPAEVQAAPSQPASTPPRTTTAPVTETPSSRPAASASATRQPAGGDYEVQRGDTLWEIARDSRASDVTINQMMMTLYRLNPDAFFQNNINALKAGAILRMPESEEAREQSVAQALASVRTQNEAWDSYRRSASGRAPVVSDQTADAEYVQQEQAVPEATDSRLKLVPPASDEQGAADAGTAAREARRLESLRDELARSREDLVSSRQENSDLRSRVDDLENLVSNLERTISLKDADLADLQNQAQMMADDSASAADAATDFGFDDELAAIEQELDASGTGTDDTSLADASSDASDASEAATGQDDSAEPAGADEAAAEPPTASRPKEPGMVEKALEIAKRPVVWGSAAIIAVLALLAGVIASRRGRSDDLGGESLVDQMMAHDQETSEMPALSDADIAIAGTDDAGDEFDAAEPSLDDLENAVSEDPGNAQPHLALLRVHYAAQDRDNFVAAAQNMHEAVGGSTHPAWMEVRAMGASLAPDHELFSETGDLAAEVEAESDEIAAMADDPTPADDDDLDLDDFSFDLDDDGGADEEEDAADDEALTLDLGDEDELALEFDMENEASDGEQADKGNSDDDGLDLDLDLDGLDLGDDIEDTLNESENADARTDFELPAVSVPDNDSADAGDPAAQTAEIELDLDEAQDERTREESETLAELESADGELGDLGLDDLDLDSDELFGDEDAVGTKLDLAKAYIDMGDPDGARGMLEEVIAEGSDDQKQEAKGLLEGLDS